MAQRDTDDCACRSAAVQASVAFLPGTRDALETDPPSSPQPSIPLARLSRPTLRGGPAARRRRTATPTGTKILLLTANTPPGPQYCRLAGAGAKARTRPARADLASVTRKVRGTPAGSATMPAGRTVTMSRRASTARPSRCMLTCAHARRAWAACAQSHGTRRDPRPAAEARPGAARMRGLVRVPRRLGKRDRVDHAGHGPRWAGLYRIVPGTSSKTARGARVWGVWGGQQTAEARAGERGTVRHKRGARRRRAPARARLAHLGCRRAAAEVCARAGRGRLRFRRCTAPAPQIAPALALACCSPADEPETRDGAAPAREGNGDARGGVQGGGGVEGVAAVGPKLV